MSEQGGEVMTKQSTDLSRFVGDKIRELRKKSKLTQKELGDKIGVKHNTISSYEKGTVSPEQDMLFALSKTLDASVDDFFPSTNKENYLDRLQEFTKSGLNIDDIQFLNKLIEKTLTLEGEDRDKFLESIKFTVEYHNKINNS